MTRSEPTNRRLSNSSFSTSIPLHLRWHRPAPRRRSNEQQPASRLVSYTLSYDAASRTSSITTSANSSSTATGAVGSAATWTQSLTYDHSDRSTRDRRHGSQRRGARFTYDANGNRTSNGGLTNQTSANNRIPSDGVIPIPTMPKATSSNGSAATLHLLYLGPCNRLTKVTERNADGITAPILKETTFGYSNDDLRVRKEVKQDLGTGLTYNDAEQFVYDGNQVVMALEYRSARGRVLCQPPR